MSADTNRVVDVAERPRPSWLAWDSYPFDIQRLPFEGGDIAYIDEGDGPVLVFVHVGMWSLVWRDVILRLRGDFRCVALDPPGSGITAGRPAGVTLDRAADAVDALVNALVLDDVTLVFHDLGGPVSLLAAGRWPGRVRALVALNTFGWRPSGVLFPTMLLLMGSPPMRVLDVISGWLPRMSSTRFGVGRHFDRRDRHVFRRGMGHRGRSAFHRYIRSAGPGRTDYGEVERATEALASRPLLTIFGERNDPGGFQPKWRERFQSTTTAIVPNGYHFPMCDDPDLVAGAIRRFSLP
jgi:pimeloyl-ACP methyl ester carboxylesterase